MSLSAFPDLRLPEILHVRPVRHGDARGWFSEVYQEAAFRTVNINVHFVQDNHSFSEKAGTVRGLHFQAPPHAQAKLVRCARGRILDVVVDIRKNSPRFGHHASFEISAEGGEQVFIPEGFAHGFCTLEPATEIIYKVSSYFARESDYGIAFNDPALAISWPFGPGELTVSDRDLKHPGLAEIGHHFSAEFSGVTG